MRTTEDELIEDVKYWKARADVMILALQEIVSPVWFIQQRAKEQGRQVDGQMAVLMAGDPEYLRRIAHHALTSSGEPIVPAPPVEAKSERDYLIAVAVVIVLAIVGSAVARALLY